MSSRTVLGGAINILQIALVRSDTSYSVFKHAIARSSALKSRLPCNARNEFVITRISGPNHGELHNGNVVSCTIHMKIIILSLHKAELNTAPHRMALLVNMCLDLIRWCCCSISFLAWESAIAWWIRQYDATQCFCLDYLSPIENILEYRECRWPRILKILCCNRECGTPQEVSWPCELLHKWGVGSAMYLKHNICHLIMVWQAICCDTNKHKR